MSQVVNMEVSFDVKMTTSLLYDFNLQHSYKKPISILSTAVGFVFILFFIKFMKWYYIAAAALLILYLPISLLRSSFMKVKLVPAFSEGMTYIINDEGITVKVGEESELVEWDKCTKACNTKQSYFVYTGKNSAFIFPQKCMGEKNVQVLQLINAHMDPKKIKIKFGGL